MADDSMIRLAEIRKRVAAYDADGRRPHKADDPALPEPISHVEALSMIRELLEIISEQMGEIAALTPDD